jgi:hypothetical protein
MPEMGLYGSTRGGRRNPVVYSINFTAHDSNELTHRVKREMLRLRKSPGLLERHLKQSDLKWKWLPN